MEKYLTVYKTTHVPSGKFYIGRHITDNPNDNYMGSGVIISTMLKKYPRDQFIKEILKICKDLDDLTTTEIEFISGVINTPLCVNLMVGDPGTTGAIFMSEATRKKRSELMKGKTFSEETKKKMSESKKKTHNTPEVRKKLSEMQKARSEEIKTHNTKIHKGKTISEEMKAKQSLALSGEKNPRAREWKVYFENGNSPIIVKGVKSWCKEHGLKYTSLYMKVRRGDSSFYQGVRIEPI